MFSVVLCFDEDSAERIIVTFVKKWTYLGSLGVDSVAGSSRSTIATRLALTLSPLHAGDLCRQSRDLGLQFAGQALPGQAAVLALLAQCHCC